MIIVHSYYTRGMHELAKVFVESFCYFHIENEVPLLITALGITAEQRRELVDLYPFIGLSVRQMPMKKWALECGVPVAKLKKWRREIEGDYVTKENKAWKLLTAGGDRVHEVRRLVDTLRPHRHPTSSAHTEPDMLVHFDIDTLFRKSVIPIETEMNGYDVGLKLRRRINPIKARITIDMMAIRRTPNAMLWLELWTAIINGVHPLEKPQGFGQSSCWQAFTEAEAKGLTALSLHLKYGLPGRNRDDNIVWNGNVHKLKKDDCVAYFREELDRLRGANARG